MNFNKSSMNFLKMCHKRYTFCYIKNRAKNVYQKVLSTLTHISNIKFDILKQSRIIELCSISNGGI